MDRNQVVEMVYKAIDEINEQREDTGIIIEKNIDSTIFGTGGSLDSLGLVSLIIALEQVVLDDCGVEIILADEKAMSLEDSPFKTVSSLVDYVCSLLDEQSGI